MNENDELRRDNDRSRHGLKEVCDRQWYYYGTTSGQLSSNQAANVYDTAKYYLDGGKPIIFTESNLGGKAK